MNFSLQFKFYLFLALFNIWRNKNIELLSAVLSDTYSSVSIKISQIFCVFGNRLMLHWGISPISNFVSNPVCLQFDEYLISIVTSRDFNSKVINFIDGKNPIENQSMAIVTAYFENWFYIANYYVSSVTNNNRYIIITDTVTVITSDLFYSLNRILNDRVAMYAP